MHHLSVMQKMKTGGKNDVPLLEKAGCSEWRVSLDLFLENGTVPPAQLLGQNTQDAIGEFR